MEKHLAEVEVEVEVVAKMAKSLDTAGAAADAMTKPERRMLAPADHTFAFDFHRWEAE